MNSIDIVIPCAGRAPDLMRLLGSLFDACAATISTHVESIVLSDDRFSSALAAQVKERFPTVRYVAGPARGPASNRNSGAHYGTADWVLFLDDDCFVRSDLLSAYLRRMTACPRVEVFEGAIHPVGPRPNGNHHAPVNTTGGFLWSCNLLLRRSVFESVGGFDETFPYACLEDCDLMHRLKAQSASIEFAPDAVVYHAWRSVSETEIVRQIISAAIYAHKSPAFAQQWDLLNVLRALRGRVRLYRLGRFSSIPWTKYRAVALDLLSPVVVYGVVKITPLRRALSRRYANRVSLAESR